MYEQFYGFSELPFSLESEAVNPYLGEKYRNALESLENSIRQKSGFCVLTGDAGVGKTTLVHALVKRLDKDAQLGLVDYTESATSDLSKQVASAFGLEVAGELETQVRRSLAELVARLEAENTIPVLIIDNAHNLPAVAFEELTELPGLENNGSMQIVLVGQPGLEESIDQPERTLFASYVSTRCRLPALSLIETDAYIRHRVTQVGGSSDLFTPSASEAVHRYSNGVPSMINRVCDLALVYGYARKHDTIDESVLSCVLNDRWGGSLLNPASDQPPAEPVAATREPETEVVVAETVEQEPAPEAAQQAIVADIPEQTSPPELEAARERASLNAEAAGSAQAEPASRLLSEQQLLELLRTERVQKEIPADNRDLAEFIRLSLQYHQQHTERFTFGVLAAVVLLAAVTLWMLSGLETDDSVQPVLATHHIEEPASPLVELSAVEDVSEQSRQAEAIPAVQLVHEQPVAPQPVVLELVEQPVLEPTPLPEASVVVPEEPVEVAAGEQDSAQTVAIAPPAETEAVTNELKEIRKQLEQEKRRLERQLEAQRAEQERLKQQTQRDRERALKAQRLAEQAKKKARLAWDQLQTTAPDAYPEE
jgi:general secretion pathway protein A